MEEILGQEMRPPIVLAQFLADYKQLLERDFMPQTPIDIQQAMDLLTAPQRFQTVVSNCSLEHLRQSDDVRVTEFLPGTTKYNRINTTQIPPEALQLKTFEMLLNAKESKARNPFARSRDIYKFVPLPIRDEHEESCDFYNDLVVTIRVYRPARATHIGQSLEKPVFAEEFECLGSNLLTELRDRLSCVCKSKRFFDVSENPSAELPSKSTDPGYFFITDTFYNDKRNPANADYSDIIRSWAKRAPGLKDLNFKVALMESTRFIDLTVSLGFPQLYHHHGNCEHVFTFAQVELLRPGAACKARRHYPRLCSFGVYNIRSCNMCGTRSYNYIVEHSDRQLHDPAYLCSKCFHSFHYIDGKKVGQFKAYRINCGAQAEDDDEESATGPEKAAPSTSVNGTGQSTSSAPKNEEEDEHIKVESVVK